MQIYAIIVATLGVIVAVAHSTLSERILLEPLYRERTDGMLAAKPMRDIIRAVFHMPSIAWAGLGIAVMLNRMQDGSDLLPIIAAIIFMLSGIGNLAALRRPHPGGLVLLAMAIATIADIWIN
ncbi:hypothetical protein [Parasphingorhabdus halotolerans]|uniref:Uncharacterized protein n=1 Tax=Parasphingorhabdus halotolerans TaxID=2725558 RepID=A0A6H2DP19_9SPHN|nr:hypothetical protein [Parasphingorhabdus halotolerans]QJB70094.1 hypothetical protein HF685_13015 [Parasphingorhabdus halotolerans]